MSGSNYVCTTNWRKLVQNNLILHFILLFLSANKRDMVFCEKATLTGVITFLFLKNYHHHNHNNQGLGLDLSQPFQILLPTIICDASKAVVIFATIASNS